MDEVVLVNELDEPIGIMEKMAAHQQPNLHRAFSIFLFNGVGEMLLQQRAFGKYHSGGLWTNTCCSHPRPGEETLMAANRRLYEEMGIKTDLTKAFHFTYQAQFDNGLIEYEFDHVFVGRAIDPIRPNPDEVFDYCFKSIASIKEQILLEPALYTPWFKIALPRLEEFLEEKTPAIF